jgi:O-antigen/teichoic acid export membrane protein
VKSQSFSGRLAAVFAGELVNKASVIVAFMWLARSLDSAVYGEVEWALSVTMVFTLIADGGLATWASAQVAAEPGRAARLIANVGWLRLFLAVPSYLVLLLIAWSYGGSAGTALAVYGLTLWVTPLFLQYLFNGLLRTSWAALGNAVRGLTFLVAVVILVRGSSPPAHVAIAEVLAASALALCNFIVLRRAFDLRPNLREGREGLLRILSQSWRIGATEVTWSIHWYAGIILLGYLAMPTDTAWHSASLRLVMALHTGVWLYLYVLLPNLARVVIRDPSAWAQMLSESIRLTGWIAAAIALVGSLAADTIFTLVFGPSFVAAAPSFRAAVLVIPTAWFSGHIRYSLIAAQHQRKDYQAALVGAATTIALTVALVPFLRSTGAGIALLGGTLANAVAAWVLAKGVLPGCAYFRSVAAPFGCGAVCVALGFAVAPFAGEVAATAIAATAFAGFAAFAEREALAKLRPMFVNALRPRIGSADDHA